MDYCQTKILVIGQTPPPYGGQAIMIEALLRGDYENVVLYHVPMRFSRHMGEVGNFRFHKVIELIRVLIGVFYARFFRGFDVLYYPPAASTWSGVLRDLVVLTMVRPFFQSTIFHFHAGGLGDFVENRLPAVLQPVVRRAYFYPDVAIQLSELSPPDAQFVRARKKVYVPNGVEDVYNEHGAQHTEEYSGPACPVILFVGALYRSKGVFDLLDAAKILKQEGHVFETQLMGEGDSETEQEIIEYVSNADFADSVRLLGVLSGEAKWSTFANADIFCFPTYFESENLSVVLLEAMMFRLPIVATSWRGIPTIIEDDENGFLVPIKSPLALARKLAILIKDPDLRAEMGQSGRQRFLDAYTMEKWRERMEQVFAMVERQ